MRKPSIAVIDDDESLRQLLSLHLRNAGYDVFAAEDAVAGGRVVVDHRPDLVICDVSMPYMDGYEFIAAMKADPATRDIPVIFLTVKDDVVDRARQLGVAYLKKPVMADELMRLVRKHLS